MKITCPKCKGIGKVELVISGIKSAMCKGCGFQAIGQTSVKRLEKHNNLCSDCGDYDI